MAARLKSVGQPLSKWVWVIDFDGFSVRDNNPLTAAKVIRILQAHHPERLGLVVMYDAPKLFGACWAAIRPLMDPETAAKVRFEQAGPDAFGFAGEELAAWQKRETAQTARCATNSRRRSTGSRRSPERTTLAAPPAGSRTRTTYIPTYGDKQLQREGGGES